MLQKSGTPVPTETSRSPNSGWNSSPGLAPAASGVDARVPGKLPGRGAEGNHQIRSKILWLLVKSHENPNCWWVICVTSKTPDQILETCYFLAFLVASFQPHVSAKTCKASQDSLEPDPQQDLNLIDLNWHCFLGHHIASLGWWETLSPNWASADWRSLRNKVPGIWGVPRCWRVLKKGESKSVKTETIVSSTSSSTSKWVSFIRSTRTSSPTPSSSLSSAATSASRFPKTSSKCVFATAAASWPSAKQHIIHARKVGIPSWPALRVFIPSWFQTDFLQGYPAWRTTAELVPLTVSQVYGMTYVCNCKWACSSVAWHMCASAR